MATDKLTNIANALSLDFSPKLARQFNRMSVLAALIPTEVGGGKSVNWDVEMDGATAASYAEGTDVASDEFAVDAIVPATLSWAHYRAAFSVSETQLDAAYSSKGSLGIKELLQERIMGAGAKLASVINVDAWVGDGTDGSGNTNLVGVCGGALEESGIYAGINRTTYPLFAGNVLANGGVGRALTADLLEQAEQNIFEASGIRPNVIVCSPDVYRAYKSLFQPLQRVDVSKPGFEFDSSTSAVHWMGIPVLRDKDAPDGTLLMGHTDYMKKVVLPNSAAAAADVASREMDLAGSNGEAEENSLSMAFKIVPLAKNGDTVRFMLKCVLALKVTRPGAFCLIEDISGS